MSNDTTMATNGDDATLPRPMREALNAILGHKFPVLHDGFIRVVDYLGTDASVVQAARVSYGAGTKTPSDDEQLIRFMLRHGHMTPFEQCEIKLHVRLPMDVMRQVVRHRTAHVNEYSTRYSEAIDSQHCPELDEWRFQSSTNRQGSGDTIETWEQLGLPPDAGLANAYHCPGDFLTQRQQSAHDYAVDVYQQALKFGVAREQARAVLPLSTYTEIYWKCDLRNLLGFLQLRMAPDAQLEIRQYATTIAEIVERWVPQTWRAFEDYKLNAVTFSATEIAAIQQAMHNAPQPQFDCEMEGLSKREAKELREKLKRLGARIEGAEGGES